MFKRQFFFGSISDAPEKKLPLAGASLQGRERDKPSPFPVGSPQTTRKLVGNDVIYGG